MSRPKITVDDDNLILDIQFEQLGRGWVFFVHFTAYYRRQVVPMGRGSGDGYRFAYGLESDQSCSNEITIRGLPDGLSSFESFSPSDDLTVFLLIQHDWDEEVIWENPSLVKFKQDHGMFPYSKFPTMAERWQRFKKWWWSR